MKKVIFGNKWILLTNLVLIYLLFSLVLIPRIPVSVSTNIYLVSHDQDTTQFFWSYIDGEEHTEARSKKTKIKKGGQVINVFMESVPRSIRLDPIIERGSFKIDKICFSYVFVQIQCWEKELILHGAEKVKNITQLLAKKEYLLVSASSDPQLIYVTPLNFIEQVKNTKILLNILFASLLLVFFLFFYKKNSIKTVFIFYGLIVGIIALFFVLIFLKEQLFSGKKVRTFDQGKAPVFVEQLYDQYGNPLTDKQGNFAVVLDPFTIYRNFPNQNVFGLTTDKNGFRGSVQAGLSKNNGLVLGGSAAFGWRLQQDADAIDEILSKKSKLHFINMAVVGHLVGQELATLVNYGLVYRPKVVISFSGWNDFFENYLAAPKQEVGYNNAFELIQIRLRNYYLSLSPKIAKSKLTPTRGSLGRLNATDLASRYFEYVKKIDLVSRAAGARFILIIQPDIRLKLFKTATEAEALEQWNRSFYNQQSDFNKEYRIFINELERLCHTNKIECFQFSDASNFKNSKQDLFLDVVHLSPEGNEILAAEILKKIKKTQSFSNSSL